MKNEKLRISCALVFFNVLALYEQLCTVDEDDIAEKFA